ncbi:NAD-dependent epimerase/dehydratase family protein [Lysobacter yananisis]|uniref:3-beta hydroxysteroid dehydrogenase/isomerase family protein n=2 Tax=Lysobacter TaxID=68 RepID=A0A0S2DKQ8_LYSEN|nr:MULTISPECIES: NAD-dependent epimerase/dehydratase family protein [Lysobacter]ALN58957.1 3-beta hydroxysteroid dehydrogenase/isomerase family protein [Lysobacter enzymogenes]QCW27205.1 NAD-dependent epimerase/dehydratase family protein [Lysobacter enzymogenes]WMT01242.1 NAD-dependent epimerase/dehydratase family protein [Lysobacter yananisis]
MTAERRIVVTGATGFLGGALARHLAATRPWQQVVGLGRDAGRGRALQAQGVEFHALDLTDEAAVHRVLRGADTVVHCAALSSPWGRREAFVAANITATEHVVAACIARQVRRLVHISTPGIYHDGAPHLGIREDHRLPAKPVNDYAATKLVAERLVFERCAAGGVSALALRPRAIFGPGDSAILPRLAQALRAGRLRRIGDEACMVDLSYIDNVVDATVLAMDASWRLGGRVYNISNGEPVAIWNVIDRLADALSLPRPRKRVPKPLALALASAVEAFHRRFRPDAEPPLLRYGVELLSVDMTLDIARAREELGYRPRVNMDEALDKTLRELARAERRT